MNETNLTQHGRSTDVNVSNVLYLRDKKKSLKKKRELIKNDVFQWQFMLCNGLCKSSSDYKSAGI